MTACRTAAAFLDRAGINLIFCIKHIHLAVVCIDMTMSSVTARIYTVKEIDSSLYTLKDICRSSNAHKIRWFILRKVWYNFIQDTIHFFVCFTYSKTTDCITVKIHLCNLFCMFDTDIFINGTLVDAKKKLFFIDRIRQAVKTVHFCLTSCQPACGTLYRFLYIVSVCHTARALVKCHSDRRSEIGLDLHTLFRSHKDLMSVNV